MTSLRVAQYHPRALVGDGGITNSVRALSAAMTRHGATARIIHAADDLPAPDGPVRWVGLPHPKLGPVTLPLSLARGVRGADVLILNSAWTVHNVRAGQVAQQLGVPYVIADRGAYDPLILKRRRYAKRAWWLAFERRLVMGSSALHVFFPSQQDALRHLGYRGPVIVAPNGVRIPEARRWDGGTGGYLLYVGRFDPEHKGLDLLVRSVATLPEDRRPEVRLHGPDWRGGKAEVCALVAQLALERWVKVGDPLYGDEKWAAMSAATAFVYPSRWEGFGNAPVEAAGIGVPVLATPYPLARHLADSGAAMVVDPTVDGLAEGIRAMAGNGGQLGHVGRDIVARQFSWDAVAKSWLDQLAKLL